MNLLHQQLNRLLNIMPCLRTGLNKLQTILLRNYNGLLGRHLPLAIQIGLGGNEHLADVIGGVGLDLMHPPLDVFERSAVGYGKGEDYARRAFVVDLRDILEPLLTRSVPNLQLVPYFADRHCFYFEVDTNGGHVGILERVLAEAGYEVGLANP
jgi:hypothetical protein